MKYPEFNPQKDKEKIVNFIKDWFDENGKTAKAVIGISGGKDSSIVASLCIEALGIERVIGVLMPNVTQDDINDALELVHWLRLDYKIVNIGTAYHAILSQLISGRGIYIDTDSPQLQQNLPPRLRMATLYAVAQGIPEGGRVINTCNRSEDYIGYSTKYGDCAGDMSPLGAYTVDEVLAIGDILNLPKHLVHKAPSDGLCGKTDEDNLGFTYEVLDKYIKTGICENEETKEKIDYLHKINKHKFKQIQLPVVAR